MSPTVFVQNVALLSEMTDFSNADRKGNETRGILVEKRKLLCFLLMPPLFTYIWDTLRWGDSKIWSKIQTG